MPIKQHEWDRALAITDRYSAQLLAVNGVTGVATGAMKSSGETIPCVRVYMRKEVGRGGINKGMIPNELDGVPVDVVILGAIKALKDD